MEGKWSVFFFYPADFTFVCPTELGDLQDKYEDFRKINCEIYSVSCDTHFVHKAWHESSATVGKVEFPMIGDPTGILAKDLDVYIEDAGLAERGTFVINPERQGRFYMKLSAGNIGRNADELLRKVQAAQFVHLHGDEVCPGKMETGQQDLKTGIRLSRKDLINFIRPASIRCGVFSVYRQEMRGEV